MQLLVQRKIFNKTNCIGELFINQIFFSYTLEDITRGVGVKIMGETAIPAGNYLVEVTESSKFKKKLPLIYNTSDYKVSMNGKSFEGIRFHGGNNEKDTLGCILVGKNTNNVKIWNSISDELTSKLDNKEIHSLQIVNKVFSEGLTNTIE